VAGAVLLVAGTGEAIGGPRSDDAAAITIRSSLDSKRVLPLRIRWIAKPSAVVATVDFLIDGKLIWTEHDHPPYVFGGDENGTDLGFLITTWLTPGSHRFTVRTGGAKSVSDTVTAAVARPPAPPAALAGFWTRVVTGKDLRKGDPSGPPGGRWTLVFDRVGAWHLDPFGSGLVNEYDVHGDVVRVYAPIQMAPFDSGGGGGIAKYGHSGIGGTDCSGAGPFGNYRWSISAGKLVLTAIREGCGNRRAIWEGTWTRKK